MSVPKPGTPEWDAMIEADCALQDSMWGGDCPDM